MEELKISRNDECWCGSGIKYKKCHMEEDDYLERLSIEHDIMIPCGILKTPEEIEGMRRSGDITRGVLDLVQENIRVGITTDEIDKMVYDYTVERGGIPATLNYGGFPKSLCTSINEVVCHGIPCDRKLEDGDIINIDVTTNLDGYFADASRMFIVGNASDRAKRIVKATKEAFQAGLDAIKPFARIGDVAHEIQRVASEYGYSVVRDFEGHGIGLEFHEFPSVSHVERKGEGMILIPGMTLTIEPMINEGTPDVMILEDEWTAVTADGKLSAQVEHTLLITEDGYEILT